MPYDALQVIRSRTDMNIFVYDEFSPEDVAMMQALYSRSAASVTEHVEKVKKTGSGKFMERFYVGYGHASIADCGSTTVFIENVSMFVAKAIQDWPLYSGQETSSRYIDFSKRGVKDPIGTKESQKIIKRWMDFYLESQEPLEAHLREVYPRKDGEDEAVYGRAIKARVFDIMRGFLPAGALTQLSWHTNLRQAHDKLALLRHHPLAEVREVAEKIHGELSGKYAHSFGHKMYPEQEEYRAWLAEKFTFYKEKKYSGDFAFKTNVNKKELALYKPVLKKRPAKTNLPLFLGELGNVTFEFLLDFGSFRDIQRHRNGTCRMPLLTTQYGFSEWYLEQLSPALRAKAKKLIKEQAAAIKKVKADPKEKQYLAAMGFNVTCKVTYGLPAAVYTMELRSGTTVHASLRRIAHKMYASMKKAFPDLVLHPDLNKDDWDVRRGLQDIREK